MLSAAFPPTVTLKKDRAYLSRRQAERIRAVSGEDERVSRVWTYYRVFTKGQANGFVYTEEVLIRSKPARMLAELDGDGEVIRIAVLSFEGPQERAAPQRWLERFIGEGARDPLRFRPADTGIA